MAKTIVGLFDRADDARSAISDLVDNGFPREDISIVANNARGEYATDDATEASEGAGAGAVGGTVVGGLTGLLIGLGALTVPGIGPVVAAGALATTLGWTAAGAGIGAAAGTLIGGLVGAGIPDDDAQVYAEGVRRGSTLVMLTTSDDRADQAANILQRHHVINVDERAAEYRQSGWTRFDEGARPYTPDELTSFHSRSAAATMRPGGEQGHMRQERDDVRRMGERSARAIKDVDVEELSGQRRAVGAGGYERYDTDFRNDFTRNYASGGGVYEDYAPVYRYGYTLGADQRYSGRDWTELEGEARTRWEERNPGTWEEFKQSVRYAWDRARAKL